MYRLMSPSIMCFTMCDPLAYRGRPPLTLITVKTKIWKTLGAPAMYNVRLT